jgi:D-alanyl-D-alanine carboxypeptidase (penicillin-binding protein 5/6)
VHLRWVIVAVLVLASGCLVGFGPPALVDATDPAGPLNPVYGDTLAQANLPPVPTIQATAAAVVNGDDGALIWGKNPHQEFAPASMTKMMTALVALQHGNLDEMITSTVDASTMPGDSVMGLHAGERLSLRDLLFGMLIPSGDDAAIVIARAVGGSQAAFVAMMNQEATALGLTDTHFANPHGLDQTGHYSSAYDMIVIGRAAMQYPLFRQIVATPQVVIRGRWVYNLTNTNYFLGRRPDVVGIKTGTTDAAGHVITVADDQDGHLLYLTVMHSPNYVPDVSALLDYFRATYTWVPLALPPSPLEQTVVNGVSRPLSVSPETSVYLPRWQAQTLVSQIDPTPDAALRVTDDPDLPPADAGVVTFSAAGQPIARLPLTAQ